MRILVVFAFMLMSCNPKAQDSVTKSQEDLKTEFSLPKKLKEVSGIALSQDQKTIWAIEESKNNNQTEICGTHCFTGRAADKHNIQ